MSYFPSNKELKNSTEKGGFVNVPKKGFHNSDLCPLAKQHSSDDTVATDLTRLVARKNTIGSNTNKSIVVSIPR